MCQNNRYPAVLLAYLVNDHPKRVDVRLRRGFRAFLTKFFRHQKFRGHERYRTTLYLRAA